MKYVKKIISLSLILLFIGSMSVQATALDQNSQKNNAAFRLINFDTILSIESNAEEKTSQPLPLEEKTTIDITIEFNIVKPWYFPKFLVDTGLGKWILFRDKNANLSTPINLSISAPDWANAELTNTTPLINIDTQPQQIKTELTITPKNDSPALSEEPLIITANFNPEPAWGLKQSSNSTSFNIQAQYKPNFETQVNVNLTNGKILITPKKITSIPIIIENKANGKAVIEPRLETNNSENWNISIIPTKIEMEGNSKNKQEINLVVTAPKNFDEKTLQLILTTYSSKDKENTSYIITKEITLKNDDSLKEKENNLLKINFDTLLLITILIAAIIILTVVTIKLRQKKQK